MNYEDVGLNVTYRSYEPNSSIKIIGYNIAIPSSVDLIGKGAFAENKITSITFPDTSITLGCGVFEFNPIMENGSYSL